MPMDEQVLHEPVGGRADLMRQWQFAWALRHGLAPHHRLLDLGCGTLRGGKAFVEYLEPGRYVGVEPRAELLAVAERVLDDTQLRQKRPTLLTLARFGELPDARFDYVLTQSVLNHLPQLDIEATLKRVARVLRRGGIWLTTLQVDPAVTPVRLHRPHPQRSGEWVASHVSPDWFLAACADLGLRVTSWPDQPHPAGLFTAVFCRDAAPVPRASVASR